MILLITILVVIIHYVSSFPCATNYIRKTRLPPSTMCEGKNNENNESSDIDDFITILGFGSLLSERSARTTFPNLKNFRLGRIPNYRRVFGHPASIFFQLGIAKLENLEVSSLSAEYVGDNASFICTVFEVPNNNMMAGGVPSMAFREREEEFDIITVPYTDLETGEEQQRGILCTRSSDEAYIARWGKERFEKYYGKYGIDSIWGWEQNSGLLPCALYLRHCTLAAKSLGSACYDSFLDETFLIDRKTTIRSYLASNPYVMRMEPPAELAARYGG
jgi:hypothetical protein